MARPSTSHTASRPARKGGTASSQAGEFVREEIALIRKGAHGVRSTKQAIAIGLSKARRAGVKLPPPKPGAVPEKTRQKALQDLATARRHGDKPVSRKRSRATLDALKRESTAPVSSAALSRQTREAARSRTPAQRSASARKAARTRASSHKQ